jgi:hypothetical protein
MRQFAAEPRRSARQVATLKLRRALEHAPALYSGLDRRLGHTSFTPIRPATALVISGFGSAGNTYLRTAVLAANPGLEIASHAHNWTEVALAARRRLPAVFLVRDPVESLASVMVRYAPAFTMSYALEEYARLYERTLPRRDALVVATFAEATSDVRGIVRRVNARFGTALAPFRDDDPAAVEAVVDHIAAYDRRMLGEQAAVGGSSPSAERNDQKAAYVEQLHRPEYADLLARCRLAYEALARERDRGE